MTAPEPTFLRLIGRRAPLTVHEVTYALALEFGPLEAPVLDTAIDQLADRLEPARRLAPPAQLAHASAALADSLHVVDADDAVLDEWLVHRVIVDGRGHELPAVLVAMEAAARAGLGLVPVASPRMVLLTHPRLGRPDVLVPSERWALRDARTLGDPALGWVCPHAAATMWLHAFRERALAAGQRDLAVQTLDAQLDLPHDRRERTRLLRLRATLQGRLS